MRGSQIFGTLHPKIGQKIFKSLFANFHNFMFTNAKFWHFLDWKKFLNPVCSLFSSSLISSLTVF